MNRVAASEFDLLSITRALFAMPGGRPGSLLSGRQMSMVTSLLKQGRLMPEGLGPTALRIFQDTVAKGLVLALMRRGGLRKTSSIDGEEGEVLSGRLWERHEPPPLHVSPFALHLCRFLAEQPLRSPDVSRLPHTPATLADELILYLAMDLAHEARCADALAAQPAVRSSALCWLAFTDVLARHESGSGVITPADVSVYGFVPWSTGTGAVILEALQPDLGRRWVAMEREKRALGSVQAIITTGRIQEAVLGAYLAALHGSGRRDLAAFLVDAAQALLAERPDARAWQPILPSGSALHLREGAHRASVVLLRNLRMLREWADSAGAVRFFDDEFDAAQAFLRLWERLGDSGFRRAGAIVAELESIEGFLS